MSVSGSKSEYRFKSSLSGSLNLERIQQHVEARRATQEFEQAKGVVRSIVSAYIKQAFNEYISELQAVPLQLQPADAAAVLQRAVQLAYQANALPAIDRNVLAKLAVCLSKGGQE